MSYGLLKGKKGVIFGALDESSIAWKAAERCHEEGAEVLLTNAPVALRMGQVNQLAEKLGTDVISCDATDNEQLKNLFETAGERFGKIDFILHSIGMSPNVRKGRAYTNLNHDWYHKTLDISAMSFHRVMQSVWELDLMNEWGSILALSYLAAQRTFGKYNDMAESKAMLESIARSFGYQFGKAKKVRVNTISQSPTPTTAGSGVAGFDAMLKFGDMMSPLGNASADECADYIVLMFSDLSKKVTMQNLLHDGGFSMVGISEEVLENL